MNSSRVSEELDFSGIPFVCRVPQVQCSCLSLLFFFGDMAFLSRFPVVSFRPLLCVDSQLQAVQSEVTSMISMSRNRRKKKKNTKRGIALIPLSALALLALFSSQRAPSGPGSLRGRRS